MRKEKQLLLDEIQGKMEGANALVLTRYQGLSPDLSFAFRSQISEAGGSFSIVKKRILMKAAEAEGISLDPEALQGHIGVVLAHDDPISATKAFFQFAKENEKVFEVIGGQFEGLFCTAKDVKAISQLPSQDEMRSQFLGLLEAPMSQTLSVMEALLTSILHCLENKAQEK